MIICEGLGLRRAGSAAIAQFMIVSAGSADLRWALVALILRSLPIIAAHFRAWLTSLAGTAVRRFAGKIGFARDPTPADTTLAAGGR
jgi:hypothetical protein